VGRYLVAFRTGCACPARCLDRPQFRPFAAGTSRGVAAARANLHW
jgi:hypothetical protein